MMPKLEYLKRFMSACDDRCPGRHRDKKRSPNETSKKNFTNNRLTNLQIFKLRAYFEKLITNGQKLEVPGPDEILGG